METTNAEHKGASNDNDKQSLDNWNAGIEAARRAGELPHGRECLCEGTGRIGDTYCFYGEVEREEGI